MDFRIPAKNFAGKILAFLYRHIRVANFFDKNSIYIAQNRISFAINICRKELDFLQGEFFMTESTRKTKSWDELTFADNFLWLNHRFRRDSLKTHLVSFTGFAVAPYLQNT